MVNREDVIILIVARRHVQLHVRALAWIWVSLVSCITHHYIMNMEIIQLKTDIEAETFFTRDERAREHPFLYGDLWQCSSNIFNCQKHFSSKSIIPSGFQW